MTSTVILDTDAVSMAGQESKFMKAISDHFAILCFKSRLTFVTVTVTVVTADMEETWCNDRGGSSRLPMRGQ